LASDLIPAVLAIAYGLAEPMMAITFLSVGMALAFDS
jgi:hypothetical protein